MGQYFSNDYLESNISKYPVSMFGNNYTFFTDNGVFSKNKLDFGTRFFLETLPISSLFGDILDVGCGYGVISIILSKVVNATFDGIDINRRALHLASRNVKENRVSNVSFFESDVYDNVSKKYHFILTNPPIRAGKKVVYKIVEEAEKHLHPGGSLFLVIRKDHGAKTLIKDFEEQYEISVLDRCNGFFVIRCSLR